MKRLLIIMGIFLLSASCTQNQRARSFGGVEEITLPAGKKLVIATWKQDDLWYVVEPMPADYIPRDIEFIESSSFGVMEGRVIFHETR